MDILHTVLMIALASFMTHSCVMGGRDAGKAVRYKTSRSRPRTKVWSKKEKPWKSTAKMEGPAVAFSYSSFVDIPPPTPSSGNASVNVMQSPIQISGIFPNYSMLADSGPTRSECGIGALMAWADNLYMVSYLSVPGGGNGTGLYVIEGSNSYQMKRLVAHRSTFANRIIHKETNQIVIGPWLIDAHGNLKTFEQLLAVRLAATAEHITDPANKVYMLGMDGPLWECDVNQLKCTQLFDLVKELHIPADRGEQPHFKAAHTMNNRLVVASNTFEQADLLGEQHGGRLAEWKGPGTNWTILEQTAFVEVTGRRNFGKVIYAVGWDKRSAILKVYDGGDSGEPSSWQRWQTYRLPKASHAFDHLWQTEWPRIREVETERYLMDAHGMFYELSPLGWAGSTWGIRPISQHLRVIPDFTSFRGTLVLGGNQVSSIFDNNVVTGQSQSGLWFGKTDDLWSFGKPQGWGAVWRKDNVTMGSPSDPYLMTGFDNKVLHITQHSEDVQVTFYIQVDYTGTAGHMKNDEWNTMEKVTVQPGGYQFYSFPPGFSAHWVRLWADHDCTATAYFHYT